MSFHDTHTHIAYERRINLVFRPAVCIAHRCVTMTKTVGTNELHSNHTIDVRAFFLITKLNFECFRLFSIVY